MRKLLGLLLFPLAVQAAGEGAWQASSIGITLNHRGVSASSAPLSSGQPVSGLMTLVAWRYELNGPTPAGLRRVCVHSPVAWSWTDRAEPPTGSRMCLPLNRCASCGRCRAAGD